MQRFRLTIFLSLILSGQALALPSLVHEEVQVYLEHPVWEGGALITTEGGVVRGEGIRIQARKIRYIERKEEGRSVQIVEAEGDLLVQYGGRFLVADRICYNLTQKSGELFGARAAIGLWFVMGEHLQVLPDGSIIAENVRVTTSESSQPSWSIKAHHAAITHDEMMTAREVQFEFLRLPLMWFPRYYADLRALKDAPIRYSLLWDKKLGPRAEMRYRIYSWRDLDAYLRVGYRWGRGWSGALETDYRSDDRSILFRTRNYGAHDKSFPDEPGKNHFRLQGLLESRSNDSELRICWDRLSDYQMQGNFYSEDFEINTEQRTELLAKYNTGRMMGIFHLQPRINPFDVVDQELPRLAINVRPFPLGRSGILFSHVVDASYLNYVYAKQIDGLIPNIHSIRIETKEELYRPITLRYLTITPHLGFTGIYYSNSPADNAAGQAIFRYGGTMESSWTRRYRRFDHTMQPYLTYVGLSKPRVKVNNYLIFSLEDGYDTLNLARVGLRSNFYPLKRNSLVAPWSLDLYTYAFIGDHTYKLLFPKAYLDLAWSGPVWRFKSSFSWNAEEQVVDYINVRADITLGRDCAFGVEMRHRSRFNWKKADHTNFVLDVAHSIHSLVESPLSDGRNTFLTHLFLRFSPDWTCEASSHHGWGRKEQPRYNEVKLDFIKIISRAWKVRFSYMHMPNDDRFTGSISLVK